MKMLNCIDIRQLKGNIEADAEKIKIETADKKQIVSLAYQKTGFGCKRYFVCPECSKRIEQLYFNGALWKCRRCSGANPYWGIQNSTKGGYDEIGYRMKRYAMMQNIEFDFPFDYLKFANDNRMKKSGFREKLMILQGLENMRFCSIILKINYEYRIIRSVLSGKHILLHTVTLMDLKNNLYDWHTGEQIRLASVKALLK